jgi:hypothetical protein
MSAFQSNLHRGLTETNTVMAIHYLHRAILFCCDKRTRECIRGFIEYISDTAYK